MLVDDDGWITVATDGACEGNPGPAGWAWVVSPTCWAAGSLGVATNNVAELEAIRRVLTGIPHTYRLKVLSDSEYAINTVTKWHRGWAKNGWRTKNGAPVQNRALIEQIVDMLDNRYAEARFEWVRGHSGLLLNEAADKLAVEARRKSPNAAMVAGPGWVAP